MLVDDAARQLPRRFSVCPYVDDVRYVRLPEKLDLLRHREGPPDVDVPTCSVVVTRACREDGSLMQRFRPRIASRVRRFVGFQCSVHVTEGGKHSGTQQVPFAAVPSVPALACEVRVEIAESIRPKSFVDARSSQVVQQVRVRRS